MIVFINPDGSGCSQTDPVTCFKNCVVTFCDVKIFGVVYADDSIGFVRVSIPEDKNKAFIQATKGLFNNFTKLGKYDSGNTGYEFTAPNLKIQVR